MKDPKTELEECFITIWHFVKYCVLMIHHLIGAMSEPYRRALFNVLLFGFVIWFMSGWYVEGFAGDEVEQFRTGVCLLIHLFATYISIHVLMGVPYGRFVMRVRAIHNDITTKQKGA